MNKFSRHKTPENREESKNKMKHEHLTYRIIRDLILCSSYLSCLVSNADFTANFIEPFTNCTHMEYSCQACCWTFFSLLVSRWRHYQMNAEKFPNQILTDLTCFPLVWHCTLYKKNAEHFRKWSRCESIGTVSVNVLSFLGRTAACSFILIAMFNRHHSFAFVFITAKKQITMWLLFSSMCA